MSRWILRVFGVLVGLLLLLAAFGVISFSSWKSEVVQSRQQDPDRRVSSTELGAIEYAVVGEGGQKILMIHGSPGGYDQSLVGARAAPKTFLPGTMTIAVSRPGFLGTPLDSGTTHQAEADLYAALLDELGIEHVVVIATSAGGRAGLQFALRHPNRTTGLVLRSARIIPRKDYPDEEVESAVSLYLSDLQMWVGRFIPSMWIDGFDPTDPLQVKMVDLIVSSIVPQSAGLEGAKNNREQYGESAIESWPLESITVPTLVLHGDADSLVTFSNAQMAARRIPGANLVTIEGGGHFMYVTQAKELSEHIMNFINSI